MEMKTVERFSVRFRPLSSLKARGDNYSRSPCEEAFFLGRQYNKKQACHPGACKEIQRLACTETCLRSQQKIDAMLFFFFCNWAFFKKNHVYTSG
jgi:hypothetical protein